MNKAELVSAVASATGETKTTVENVVAQMISSIKSELASGAGSKVTLVGFGTFETVKREARTGRNPQTGATIKIAASKTVKFKAGKDLKESVN